MIQSLLLDLVQVQIVLYFISINLFYIVLSMLSFKASSNSTYAWACSSITEVFSDSIPSVSLLAPTYNEELTIVSTLKSMLQLKYSKFEILVINDGSSDKTLSILKKEFDLKPISQVPRNKFTELNIKNCFKSVSHPNLKVIDQVRGGKSTALNAGIAMSESELFCCVDADSILQRNSLLGVVQPFLEDETTVAVGGTLRVTNGCKVKSGNLISSGLPKSFLALFQVIEYIRAFLFGRMGWSYFNSLLIISGSFSIFRKSAVIAVGGYKNNMIGEDMELIIRLHSYFRSCKLPYKISFISDPICWTEVPENFIDLAKQRMRWQIGLADSLIAHWSLLFKPSTGMVGTVAFPFFFFFELLGPVLEVFGYLTITSLFFMGLISTKAFFALLTVAIGMGLILSITALLFDQISFRVYQKNIEMVILFLVAIAENFGYRQLTTLWRFMGLILWVFSKNNKWDSIKRRANWDQGSLSKG